LISSGVGGGGASAAFFSVMAFSFAIGFDEHKEDHRRDDEEAHQGIQEVPIHDATLQHLFAILHRLVGEVVASEKSG